MTIEEIINNHEKLNKELRIALSTMERSNTIAEIRSKIIKNQMACPHISDKYNWTVADGKCPYCGFTFDRGRDY